jgi:hypothetical protein
MAYIWRMRPRHAPPPRPGGFSPAPVLIGLAVLAFAAAPVPAQPAPAPASGEAVCEGPPSDSAPPGLSAPDSEGFRPLFNGIDFTGWWLDCGTRQSQAGSGGPIFRVDRDRKAIYSTQRGTQIGGALMTRARFADYEIVFDYWPDWGNRASLLNRSDSGGRAYATTLGYTRSAGFGGVWGEGGFPARDFRPFMFDTVETSISTPGSSNDPRSWWTELTRMLMAHGEDFPCPATGCAQAEWRKLWDPDGWNQIRILFRGGRASGDPVHARTWFRKWGASDWVPLEEDTTLAMEIPPGYIGLQVAGGGAYGGPRGTWYRDIRWRPWDPAATGIDAPRRAPGPRRSRIETDRERQGNRVVFAGGDRARDIGVYALDGKRVSGKRGAGARKRSRSTTPESTSSGL